MFNRMICTAVMMILLVPVISLSGQPAASVDRNELQDMILAFQEQHQVPGLSVAIGIGNDIYMSGGFGKADLENGIPAKADTVYRTASIAKSITAVAVMQLVERGKLDLEDPIGMHCPEFPEMENPPTIRHLLCHQAGVRHYKNPIEPSGKTYYPTIKDSLVLFINDPLLFEPGEKFSYTTYGYSLLGRAIETASGQSYDAFLQENVFDVAGMSSTGLDNIYQIIPGRTRGYARMGRMAHRRLPPAIREQTQPDTVFNCQLHDTSMKVAGGGLVSSSVDLVRLGQAMLQDRLMKPATREVAWTAQQTNSGSKTTYGLGWNVIKFNDDLILIGHSGGQAGTATHILIVPKHQLVVSAMCNLQGTPCPLLTRQLANRLMEEN